MYSVPDLPKGGVAPFGHPRINDRSHLPAAYRSVPRPSSPLGAKASTERPSHTHPSPPARRTNPHPKRHASSPHVQRTATQHRDTLTRQEVSPPGHSISPIRFTCERTRITPAPRGTRMGFSGSPAGIAPRGSFFHPMEAIGFEPTTPCLQSRRSPAELRPLTGTPSTGANQAQRSLTHGPKPAWAREDLNLRPHAYQACALTN